LVLAAVCLVSGCGSSDEPAPSAGAGTPARNDAAPSAPGAGAPGAAESRGEAAPRDHDRAATTDTHDDGAAPHTHDDETPSDGEAPGPLVPLTATERENVGLKTELVTERLVEEVRRFPGVIKPHPDRVALVTSRTAGRIVNIHAKIGERVARGQDLIEVQSVEVERLEIELIQAENRYRTEKAKLELELAQAQNKLRLAEADANRNRVLVEKGIGARKELITAENQLQAVQNDIAGLTRQLELLAQASRNETEGLVRQLTLLGLPRSAIERVRREQSVTLLHIPAPLSGLIVDRPVSLGQIIDPTTTLFKITDDSVVIAEGDVFEDLLPLLRPGQRVRLSTAAFPGRVFEGTLTFIHPVVDPQKRTVHVWALIPNTDRQLKQDMFAELRVVVSGGKPALAVPLAAVIAAEGEEFVFVEREDGFARVAITGGARDDRFVEVTRGLTAGDRVVTDGNRQVYAKLLTMQAGGAVLGGHTH
jgi:cobalt-zinc-cadmium efflux system membrane fusion protein